ncbi:MAG: RNA-binding S4 domain-containing protein [Hyphomicrobiales bacterium]|nr:RNA-binding S4 domain-containing protein [Hyphomicrobiales bacterium]
MMQTATGQRVDQWLWHARLIKSRSLAARLVEAGSIRVNRQKILKSGHQVKPGDVLTFMYADQLRVIEVVALARRRGPAREARQLYQLALTENCEQSTHGDQKGDAQ